MVANNKGQSILEIVFILPFLLMFVVLLYKITMAVQMAINNTQYARSQIYVLTANSPEYPRLGMRLDPTLFANNKQDRMVLGVADPKALASANANNDSLDPLPQTQKIGRAGSTEKGSEDLGEVKKRTEIRVRNTAAICTQLNAVSNKKPMNEANIPSLGGQTRWPFNMEVCQYSGTKI